MQRNPIWILFISVIILLVVGYTGYAFVEIWKYIRLDRRVEAQEIHWSVISLSDDAFIPFAQYSFKANDKNYRGQAEWQETYLNEWAAHEAVGRLEQSPPQVWFDSKDPDISALQKNFPFKISFYALLLWILGIYFVGLGYYVNKRIF